MLIFRGGIASFEGSVASAGAASRGRGRGVLESAAIGCAPRFAGIRGEGWSLDGRATEVAGLGRHRDCDPSG
jgi:hypothetical protein